MMIQAIDFKELEFPLSINNINFIRMVNTNWGLKNERQTFKQ